MIYKTRFRSFVVIYDFDLNHFSAMIYNLDLNLFYGDLTQHCYYVDL